MVGFSARQNMCCKSTLESLMMCYHDPGGDQGVDYDIPTGCDGKEPKSRVDQERAAPGRGWCDDRREWAVRHGLEAMQGD